MSLAENQKHSLTVTWQDFDAMTDLPVMWYKIEYGAHGNFSFGRYAEVPSGGENRFTLNNLNSNTLYKVTVTSMTNDTKTQSDPSVPASGVTGTNLFLVH